MNETNHARANVLLAEDDPADQERVRRVMERLPARTDLRTVHDGQEMMDYLYRREKYSEPRHSPRPDLILLDLNLPHLSGIEVMDALRADSDLCRIPVIILTTSLDEEEMIQSYQLGSFFCLRKPLTLYGFTDAAQALNLYWYVSPQTPVIFETRSGYRPVGKSGQNSRVSGTVARMTRMETGRPMRQ